MKYETVKEELRNNPRRWLVTGAAGFIGSHLVETLIGLNQRVVGLDNLATGKLENLAEVKRRAGKAGQAFTFHEGSINDLSVCHQLCENVDYVLHQGALGSVPRSLSDPLSSHNANVSGFLNVAFAAKSEGVKKMVYASSSSVYGSSPILPKIEGSIGKPLSPYAATKLMNEIYADVMAQCYSLPLVGLRYFNVFGPRQDPNGAYAAVIPRWIGAILRGEPVMVNGDGNTTRDFCFVANAVQANILAATSVLPVGSDVFNVSCGAQTTLSALIEKLHRYISAVTAVRVPRIERTNDRPGDIKHSLAEIGKAKRELGYEPTHSIDSGLELTCAWYAQRMPNNIN